MKVGILAVQGDYEAHAAAVERAGATPVLVRKPADLAGVDALILPGGESTTQLQFLREEGLDQAIAQFARSERPIFGTCAGAILLAREVHNPAQESLSWRTSRWRAMRMGGNLPAMCGKARPRLTISRLRWCLSARPSSRKSARALKSWRNPKAIPSWCGRKIC